MNLLKQTSLLTLLLLFSSNALADQWVYFCKWDKLNQYQDDRGVSRIHNERKRVQVTLNFETQEVYLKDELKGTELVLASELTKVRTMGASQIRMEAPLSNQIKEEMYSIFMSSAQRSHTPILHSDLTTIKKLKISTLAETVHDFSLVIYGDIANNRGQILKDRVVTSLDCYSYLP